MERIRLVYSKGYELQFTGNLDMQKVWERSFRRANLPLAYSQGFHPQARIHQACPLPLGFLSSNDLIDIWLTTEDPIEKIQNSLQPALQPGITIQKASLIPLQEKPLQTLVKAATYQVQIDEEICISNLQARIDEMLSKKEIQRERRGKAHDLRPLIEKIDLLADNLSVLQMTLTALPSATGRPEEVIDELGIPWQETIIERTGLILTE
jgi:radical SAM-linked protein